MNSVPAAVTSAIATVGPAVMTSGVAPVAIMGATIASAYAIGSRVVTLASPPPKAICGDQHGRQYPAHNDPAQPTAQKVFHSRPTSNTPQHSSEGTEHE